MEQLKKDYNKAIYQLEKLREGMDEEEKDVYGSIIGGMISDLRYALEWINTGRRPGNRRGIERKAAYQREKLVDPILIQGYVSQTGILGQPKRDAIAPSDLERIEFALSFLTEREREIYLMTRGNGLSFGEVAKILNISKSRVQGAVKRAEEKIANNVHKVAL